MHPHIPPVQTPDALEQTVRTDRIEDISCDVSRLEPPRRRLRFELGERLRLSQGRDEHRAPVVRDIVEPGTRGCRLVVPGDVASVLVIAVPVAIGSRDCLGDEALAWGGKISVAAV